jgi:hypothetical protein
VTGIAGNAATLAVGKQTAKGTPQATPTYKLLFTGGVVAPNREIVPLVETDGSFQAPNSFVGGYTVDGTTEHYVRPDDFGLLSFLTMGANADSGTNPNYIHTATPARPGIYATLFKAHNVTTLVDRYSDCRINQLVVRGQAGGALTCAVTWQGLVALLGSTDPVLAQVTQTPLVYPNVTVTKNALTPGTVDSFELTITNGGQRIRGDSGLIDPDFVFGRFEVTGTASLLFESDADYRSFHTGSPSGTAVAGAIFAESWTILAQVTANLSVSFVMTAVEYTAYPIAPNPAGDPIRVALAFRTQRQATIANNLSIITKNTVASY